jgi:hypothetical protein
VIVILVVAAGDVAVCGEKHIVPLHTVAIAVGTVSPIVSTAPAAAAIATNGTASGGALDVAISVPWQNLVIDVRSKAETRLKLRHHFRVHCPQALSASVLSPGAFCSGNVFLRRWFRF